MLTVAVALVCTLPVSAQNAPDKSVSCTFEDGKSLTLRHKATASGVAPAVGKVWAPGNVPMFLLTETPLEIGGKTLSTGAYSVYLLPQQPDWMLIVNKNVSAGEKYSKDEDVVRIPLSSGKLSNPVDELSAAFGHVAPKQCNLRIYYEKTGMWMEIKEK
jgi:hypothetical protein